MATIKTEKEKKADKQLVIDYCKKNKGRLIIKSIK